MKMKMKKVIRLREQRFNEDDYINEPLSWCISYKKIIIVYSLFVGQWHCSTAEVRLACFTLNESYKQ